MLLSIGPLGTNLSEILIKIKNFLLTKIHLKISSARWRPFCPRGDQLTLAVLNLFPDAWKYIYIFPHSSILRWWFQLKSFLVEDKDPFILHIQHHGCWWPGVARSQGISSHGIDVVILEYSVSVPEGLTHWSMGKMCPYLATFQTPFSWKNFFYILNRRLSQMRALQVGGRELDRNLWQLAPISICFWT